MIDAEKEEDTTQLMMSYLRYKGGNINSFIQAATKVNKLDKLRNRVGINTRVPEIS